MGDGHQTRSFMYIDDCIKGTLAITASDISSPSTWIERVGDHQPAVDIVEEIAGVRLERHYNRDAPKA